MEYKEKSFFKTGENENAFWDQVGNATWLLTPAGIPVIGHREEIPAPSILTSSQSPFASLSTRKQLNCLQFPITSTL